MHTPEAGGVEMQTHDNTAITHFRCPPTTAVHDARSCCRDTPECTAPEHLRKTKADENMIAEQDVYSDGLSAKFPCHYV